MSSLMRRAKAFAPLFLLASASGCGSDDSDPAAAAPVQCADTSIDTAGCSVALSPGANDTEALQGALIDAKSGDTVCLCPGTFKPTAELSLTVPNVTIKGVGANIEDSVIDFAGQTSGDDGLTATADGFTVENFAVKNSPGNGIVVTGADGVIFRKIKVSWDAGSATSNGAYAVYPVKSKNVIIEDSEIIGAADAGAYVGQCENAIVRRNKVHANVAGIEIENTTNADVYENEAYDNTSGILVFTLPNLEKTDGMGAKVHNNIIRENNRPNFAEKGTIVANVPAGTGMLVLAADVSEIHDNDIKDNNSTGIIVVAYSTLSVFLGMVTPDPNTDPFPEKTYIHDNTFTNNGTDPQDILGSFGTDPLPDVMWDGTEDPMKSGAEFCLGTGTPPSFVNFAGLPGANDPSLRSTDPTPHLCTGTELPALSF